MAYSASEIKESIKKVLAYSQGIEDPKIDKLFELWFDNKRDIIEAMNGNLIYEIEEPFTFELSEEGKADRVSSFIGLCWDLNLTDLASFLEAERKGFFNNVCEDDWGEAKKGTKLVKAFKYFVKDSKVLAEMQNKASMIIQENKVTGKLCFSVHPLDYLSISETTYNWRSCHALDGEYRAGNLSYMMDNSTVVCYLKGEDNVKLPRFPEDVLWNSKKWRVLLYLSNDWKMIFAGKQYPFSSLEGMNAIIDKCFNASEVTGFRKPSNRTYDGYRGSSWSHWSDYTLPSPTVNDIVFDLDHSYIPVGGSIIALDDLVVDGKGTKHFNDVLRSSCYKPMYTYLIEKGWWADKHYTLADYKTRFNIGEYTYCLRCGEKEVMDMGSATMMCYDCEREYGTSENDVFGFCKHCGRRIETENGYYIEEDLYCGDCFDEYGARCEDCRDYYLKENMHYDEDANCYFCNWCHDNHSAQDEDNHQPRSILDLWRLVVDDIDLDLKQCQKQVFSFSEEAPEWPKEQTLSLQ